MIKLISFLKKKKLKFWQSTLLAVEEMLCFIYLSFSKAKTLNALV